MTFEEALEFVETTLKAKTGKKLSEPEKEILKAAWDNQTYNCIADSLYLTVGHIKDLASLLWQRISDAMGKKVTKNNFKNILQGQLSETDSDETKSPKGNILIVDDLAENLQFLTEILSKRGYKVRSVTNGKMALRTVRNNPPDVILLDIKMPDMDGYQVCQALKAEENISETPVIFLSSLDEVFDKIKAFKVGGVDYITKQFFPEEVIARIQNQITLQKQKILLRQQIEKHQQTAEILFQSRSLLANLLNTSPEGIAALQTVRNMITGEIEDFSCLIINPILSKILGTKREDLINNSRMKTTLNQFIPGLFNSLVRVVETGETLEQEFNYKNDNTQKTYCLVVTKFADGVAINLRNIVNCNN